MREACHERVPYSRSHRDYANHVNSRPLVGNRNGLRVSRGSKTPKTDGGQREMFHFCILNEKATRVAQAGRWPIAASRQDGRQQLSAISQGPVQVILVPMTVHLSPHGQELLETALARGVGRSPEEVVERALEAANGMAATLSDDELARRRQAVAGMVAFREGYHLTLGPGERIQDLIHEGRKY